MRVAILAIIVTMQGSYGHVQYNGQWLYCGLNTASVVFLIFYYHLYTHILVCFPMYTI